MTESKVINYIKDMQPLDKLGIYMSYFINMKGFNYNTTKDTPRTFNEFCSTNNISVHKVGDDWEETGYASKEWITFNHESIFFYILVNIK